MATLVWVQGRGGANTEPRVRLDLTLDEAEALAHLYGPMDGAYDEIMREVDRARPDDAPSEEET